MTGVAITRLAQLVFENNIQMCCMRNRLTVNGVPKRLSKEWKLITETNPLRLNRNTIRANERKKKY